MLEFGALTTLIKRVRALDINDALFFVFEAEENKEFILFLNRTEQIFKQGLNADGTALPLYTFGTEELSSGRSYTWQGITKRKQEGQRYFLVESGKLFDSFEVKVNKKSIEIKAFTIKDGENLLETIGSFVGLTEQSQNELIEKIIPQIINYIKNFILA